MQTYTKMESIWSENWNYASIQFMEQNISMVKSYAPLLHQKGKCKLKQSDIPYTYDTGEVFSLVINKRCFTCAEMGLK